MAEETYPYPSYPQVEQPPLMPMSLMAEVADKVIEPDETTKKIYELLNKDLRVGNIDEREANVVMNTIGFIANVKYLCKNVLKFPDEEINNMTFDKTLAAHASALIHLSVSKEGFMLKNVGTVRQFIERRETREKKGFGDMFRKPKQNLW